MFRRPGIARTAGPLLAAALAAFAPAHGPAHAADTTFYWGGGINGGYTSNVFFSDDRDVSSTGGSVALSFGTTTQTPKNVFDLSYGADYFVYEDDAADGADNLSHTLGAYLQSQWSPRTTFTFTETAYSTPEQNTFVLRPENPFSVTQRSRRTRFDTELDWNVDLTTRTGLRLSYDNSITEFEDAVSEDEDPLRDELSHRAGVGVAFRATERSEFGFGYQFTTQEFDEVGGDQEDSENDAHSVSGDYSWDLSEESRGRVSAGILRNEGEQTSQGRQRSTTTWLLGASIYHRLGQRTTSFFGASRNVSSFGGLGGTAIGETAFASLSYQTSERSTLGTTANWTNRREFQQARQNIRTLSANAQFRHRVARWGGYNFNYFFIDQSIGGDVTDLRRDLTYDLIRAGLFFQRPGAKPARRRPL